MMLYFITPLRFHFADCHADATDVTISLSYFRHYFSPFHFHFSRCQPCRHFHASMLVIIYAIGLPPLFTPLFSAAAIIHFAACDIVADCRLFR
jgi:hypothetical protein